MKTNEVKDVLKVIPLGGQGEIGKNCWILECKDEIIIVNFGMMLPQRDLTGVDLVLPNTTYLLENEKKIKGLIITSGHDDSCGGVFYLLNKVKIPKVYGSKLAIETVQSQFVKSEKLPEVEFLESRKAIKIGNLFTVRPFNNTFILPDTYGLYIQTASGSVLYTGSYKIDQTPLDNVLFDYFSYAQCGEEGVDLLISDSANIESSGYSLSECAVTRKFEEIIKGYNSRIIIVSYANNLYKFQIIFNIAKKNNKKVFLCGDYLINKIQAAVKSGFMNIPKDLLISEKELQTVSEKELVIIVSGKYGDFLPSLIEIAKGEHKQIKLKSTDVVVISSNPPPGTARILAHTIDQLFVQKVQVISGRGQGVHISGHASQEEAKFILTVAKPRSFVPTNGEERQLVIYGNIAETMGISPNDIHILKNGDVIELRGQIARVASKVTAQTIYYNLALGLDIEEDTMKERQALSKEGTITIALTLDEKKNIIAGPEILAEACSFAKGKDWRAFCLGTVELVKDALKQAVERDEKDILDLKTIVSDTVNKNVLELIAKRPLINVSIQEVVRS